MTAKEYYALKSNDGTLPQATLTYPDINGGTPTRIEKFYKFHNMFKARLESHGCICQTLTLYDFFPGIDIINTND